MPEISTPPPLPNRLPPPAGVMPKNLQRWALLALTLVMVLVIAFSNRNAPQKMTAPLSPGDAVVDPNDARIREYREQIEREVQQLAQEQARLRAAQAQAGSVSEAGLVGGALAPGASAVPPLAYGAASGESNPTRNWTADDRERRRQSRYASNVALTHRADPAAERAKPPTATAAKDTGDNSPTDDALGQASGKRYRLFEGTLIETALMNRLDSSFSGPVSCLVTTPVYSHDRTKLLIPQGSRVLGTVRRVESFGEQRLAVSFERLIMPDGFSVDLKGLPGLSQVGETGLLDQVNRHYGQVFGVSLAIGAIAGLSQMGTSYGSNASAADAYRQGVAGSLSQTSLNILDRYLNVLPTFTVREGHRVKVYLTGDLLLPAYDNHQLPNDL